MKRGNIYHIESSIFNTNGLIFVNKAHNIVIMDIEDELVYYRVLNSNGTFGSSKAEMKSYPIYLIDFDYPKKCESNLIKYILQ